MLKRKLKVLVSEIFCISTHCSFNIICLKSKAQINLMLADLRRYSREPLLSAITEANDAVMNFGILKKMFGIWISLTGIKNKLIFFACGLCVPFFSLTYFPHSLHGNALNVFYT